MIDRSTVMRRAWSLTRQAMQPFSRPLFAACLRQAWTEARNAPVNSWDDLLRAGAHIGRGMGRDEVIQRLQGALRVAKGKAAQYRRAGEPRDWATARYRSNDLMRVANLEAVLAREVAGQDGVRA